MMTGHPSFKISTMALEDINEVALIEKESYIVPWTSEAFIRELNLTISRSIVAKVAADFNRIVVAGYIIFWVIDDEAELQKITIQSNFRRQGLASVLIKEMFNLLKAEKCRYCVLEVGSSNESAIRLYHKFGFSIKSIRRQYYSETGEDALIMEADIGAIRY